MSKTEVTLDKMCEDRYIENSKVTGTSASVTIAAKNTYKIACV